jgi:hypothetical protein
MLMSEVFQREMDSTSATTYIRDRKDMHLFGGMCEADWIHRLRPSPFLYCSELGD